MTRAQALQIADYLAGRGFNVTITYVDGAYTVAGMSAAAFENIAKIRDVVTQSETLGLAIGVGVTITDKPVGP